MCKFCSVEHWDIGFTQGFLSTFSAVLKVSYAPSSAIYIRGRIVVK